MMIIRCLKRLIVILNYEVKLWGIPNDSFKQQWEMYIQEAFSIQSIVFALFYFLNVLEKYTYKKQLSKVKQNVIENVVPKKRINYDE